MTIRVSLPDGSILDTETTDEAVARTRVQEVLGIMEQSRPLQGFVGAGTQAARGALGAIVGGAGQQAQERLGFGGETLGAIGQAISGQAPTAERNVTAESFLRDITARPGQALSNLAGQATGSVLGSAAVPAAVGAGLLATGAAAPVVAGGTLASAILTGSLQGTSEMEGMLRAEGIAPERARELSTTIGALIGAAEGGAAGLIVQRVLGNQVRRETVERLAEMAQRGRFGAARREAGQGALIEGASEGLGGAARQAVVAGETGNADFARRAGEVLFEAGVGGLGGGIVTGAAGLAQPGRAREALAAQGLGPDGQPLPPPAPPPQEPPPASAPEAPLPFASRQEAANYLRGAGFGNLAQGNLSDEALIANAENVRSRIIPEREAEAALTRNISAFVGAVRTGPGADRASIFLDNLASLAATDQLDLGDLTTSEIIEAAGGDVENAQHSSLVNAALENLARQGVIERNPARPGGTAPSYRLVQRNVVRDQLRSQAAAAQAQLRPRSPALLESLRNEVRTANPTMSAAQIEEAARRLYGQRDGGWIDSQGELARATASQEPNLGEGRLTEMPYTGVQPAPTTQSEYAAQWVLGNLTVPDNQRDIDTNLNFLRGLDPSVAALYAQYIDAQQSGNVNAAANITSFLTGRARGELVGQDETTTPFEDAAPVFTDVRFPSETRVSESPEVTQFFAERAERMATELRDEATDAGITELLNNVPLARDMFSDMLNDPENGVATNKQWSWRDWQRLFAERGMPLTPTQAGRINVAARELGLLDFNFRQRPTTAEQQGPARPSPPPAEPSADFYDRAVAAAQELTRPGRQINLGAVLQRLRESGEGQAPNMAQLRQILGRAANNAGSGIIRRAGSFGLRGGPPGGPRRQGPAPRQPGTARSDRPAGEAPPGQSKYFSAAEVAAAQDLGRRLTGGRVDIEGVPDLVDENGNTIFGEFVPRENLIRLATNIIDNTPLEQTVVHEAWHAVESAGVVPSTDSGRLDMLRAVNERAIRQEFPHLTPEYLASLPNVEVRALGAEVALRNAERHPTGLRGIYKKFTDFVGRLVRAMRNQPSTADIYRKLLNETYARDMQRKEEIEAQNLAAMRKEAPPTFLVPPAADLPVLPAAKDMSPLARFVLSPTLTMGKMGKGIYRQVSDSMRGMFTRRNEFGYVVERGMRKLFGLSKKDNIDATRAMLEASRTRRAPDYSKLSPAAAEAVRDYFTMINSAFDMFLESYIVSAYDPGAVTANGEPMHSATRQARLRAMWERNADKDILQISRTELRAANPAGFAQLQELENLRNPYYVPMTARGSHFIAVYKRRPTGERGEIVKMAIFAPSNAAMRLRGVNEEQYFRNELKKMYPDDTKYVFSEMRALTDDNSAGKIDFNVFEQFLNRLGDIRNDAQAQEIIRDLRAKKDKMQLQRMFRPNNDLLLAVHPKNEETYVRDTLPQYFEGLAAVQAAAFTENDFLKGIKNLGPQDKEYWQTHREYSTNPVESYSGLRAFAFLNLMGFAPDTAFVNALQTVQTTIPMLLRDGGLPAIKHAREAARVAGGLVKQASKILKRGQLGSPDTVEQYINALDDADAIAAMRRATREGVFIPLYALENRGQFTVEGVRRAGFSPEASNRIAGAGNSILRYASALQSAAEQYNRLVAFKAFFALAKENPQVITKVNASDFTKLKDAYDYASYMTQQSQLMVSKEDRALLQRFTPLAEVATQFMSFPLKMTELYLTGTIDAIKQLKNGQPALAKSAALGVLATTASLVTLAGVWALPGAEFLRELFEAVAKLAFGTDVDLDLELRQGLSTFAGGNFANFASAGLPYATETANLAGRLAVNPMPFDRITDPTLFTLLGPIGSIGQNALRFGQNFQEMYARQDYVGLARLFPLTPRAMGNALTGATYGIFDTPVRTQQGGVIGTPTLDAASGSPQGNAVRLAIGFPPTAHFDRRAGIAAVRNLNEATRGRVERLNAELAEHLRRALVAQQAGDMTTANNEFARYSRRISEAVLAASEEENAARRVLPNISAVRERAILDMLGRGSELALLQQARRAVRPEVENLARLRNLMDEEED